VPRLVDPEILQRALVLSRLPTHELEQLAAVMRERRYAPGEVVFHQGDPGDTLHVVLEGGLKIVLVTDAGEEAIMAVLGPGDLCGELALLDGAPRSASVVALEPLRTATLGRAEFLALLRRSSTALEALLALLAATIRRKDEAHVDLIGLDVHRRLAKRLLQLADAHGHPGPDGTEIALPLTQEELAAMIGTTRASVNRALGFYQDRGLIALRGRRITLLKPDLLSRSANF
jgi:CRP/FNR family transcriptional regulator, cyclic AMP receptor protein